MSYEDLKRSMNWDSKAHKQDTRPLTTWSRLFGQLCRIPNSLILTLPAGKKGCFVIRFSHDGRSVALDMHCVCVCQSHHLMVCLPISCVSVSSPHGLSVSLITSWSVSFVCVSFITSWSVSFVCQSHHLMVCQFCVCYFHHLMVCKFCVCQSHHLMFCQSQCVSLIISCSVCQSLCVSAI